MNDTTAAAPATPLTRADGLVLAFGVLWPMALMEALKAWGRYTSLGLPHPTGATREGSEGSRTPRKD